MRDERTDPDGDGAPRPRERPDLRGFLERAGLTLGSVTTRRGARPSVESESPAGFAARVAAALAEDATPRPYTHAPDVSVEFEADAERDALGRRNETAFDVLEEVARELAVPFAGSHDLDFYVLSDVVLAVERGWPDNVTGTAVKATEPEDEDRTFEGFVSISTGLLAVPEAMPFHLGGERASFDEMRSLITDVVASSRLVPDEPVTVEVRSGIPAAVVLEEDDQRERLDDLERGLPSGTDQTRGERFSLTASDLEDLDSTDASIEVRTSDAVAANRLEPRPVTERDTRLFDLILRSFEPRGYDWVYSDQGSYALMASHHTMNISECFEIGTERRPDPAEGVGRLRAWLASIGEDPGLADPGPAPEPEQRVDAIKPATPRTGLLRRIRGALPGGERRGVRRWWLLLAAYVAYLAISWATMFPVTAYLDDHFPSVFFYHVGEGEGGGPLDGLPIVLGGVEVQAALFWILYAPAHLLLGFRWSYLMPLAIANVPVAIIVTSTALMTGLWGLGALV